MKAERQFNFFEIESYVSHFRCDNAKEALSWLAMYHSAMKEDMSSYDPHTQRPFSYWTNLCPEVSLLKR